MTSQFIRPFWLTMASEIYKSDNNATSNAGRTTGGGGSAGSGGTGRPSSQVGGVAFQLPPGNPPGLGTQATPMFFCMMPSSRTTVMSLYGNFLDIDSKDQKTLWRKMVKPSNDHVLLNMTVTNSKAIVDLFKDKAITCRWMHFMHIPTAGTEAISPTPLSWRQGHFSCRPVQF
jgi:hypothetical protein